MYYSAGVTNDVKCVFLYDNAHYLHCLATTGVQSLFSFWFWNIIYSNCLPTYGAEECICITCQHSTYLSPFLVFETTLHCLVSNLELANSTCHHLLIYFLLNFIMTVYLRFYWNPIQNLFISKLSLYLVPISLCDSTRPLVMKVGFTMTIPFCDISA